MKHIKEILDLFISHDISYDETVNDLSNYYLEGVALSGITGLVIGIIIANIVR